MNNETQQNKHIAIIAVAAFFIILIAWTGARLLWLSLESHFEITKIEWVEFTYWLIVKAILWIMPAIWMLKRCGKASEIFRIRSWRKTLSFGLGIGGALLVMSVGSRIITDNWSMPYNSLISFLGVVIIAPIFEEFLVRGAVLSSLKRKVTFIPANLLAALLFTLLHFPGWYFNGELITMLLNPLNGALAIFIIGFLCGLAAEKGESLFAAIIVHMLNNLF